MTRDAILRATHARYEQFFSIWRTHADSRGPGVLVFISGADSREAGDIDVGFLTLKELRDYLHIAGRSRGIAYRWVKQSAAAGGIPLIILPHADRKISALSPLHVTVPASNRSGSLEDNMSVNPDER